MVEYREFTREDMLILPDTPEAEYRVRTSREKKAIHHGQRKLMLSELDFLTTFWDHTTVPNPIIVYAGSAPGIHIPFLAELFPQATWHLYDPSPFTIKPTEKIHIYSQLFTQEVAQSWSEISKKDSNIFFISDIRFSEYKRAVTEEEQKANENAVKADLMMQADWVRTINPVQALLKFRLPYAYSFEPKTFNYLNGYVFRQPYAPQSSTETRLVPIRNEDGSWQTTDWDIAKYGNQLFYHNSIVRETYRYYNPFYPIEDKKMSKSHIDFPELLLDYDSTAETYILINYLYKVSGTATREDVIALSRHITKILGGKLLSRLRNPGPLLIRNRR